MRCAAGLLIACSYDPSGRYRMGVVFRTLALLAPRHPNMHVVVFGPGVARRRVSACTRRRSASVPSSRFLGDADDERRVMRAAQRRLGRVGRRQRRRTPVSISWRCAFPCIAERSPLTQHYVADGITGMLLAPGDPSYTASAVAAFLGGEEKRIGDGERGPHARAARVRRERR